MNKSKREDLQPTKKSTLYGERKAWPDMSPLFKLKSKPVSIVGSPVLEKKTQLSDSNRLFAEKTAADKHAKAPRERITLKDSNPFRTLRKMTLLSQM